MVVGEIEIIKVKKKHIFVGQSQFQFKKICGWGLNSAFSGWLNFFLKRCHKP